MKGATMKVTMERLGVTASYSRPRVSNDNPFSEALFRTCKYQPGLADHGVCHKRRCAGLGESLRPLVQQRAPPQRDPLRHAQTRATPARTANAGQPRHALCRSPCAKPGTLVRPNPQLATRRTRLAQPRTRNDRPQNQRRGMKSADNSFDKHRFATAGATAR